METIKHKFTKLQENIFSLCCIHAGNSLNLSEIANKLKVSVTAVSKAVPLLEKETLITIQRSKKMKLVVISLNQESKKAIRAKRIENLRAMYESKLIDKLEEELYGSTVIVFGSYSRGEDIFSSDIDIATIGRKEKSINLSAYEKILNRKIVLNFYPSLKEVHKSLRENLCNGIVLMGGIQL